MKFIVTDLRVSFTENIIQELTLTLKSKHEMSELKDILAAGKELSVEIKPYRQKRSLDANSYAWVLISQMADILRADKDEVYVEMLKKYGQREKQLLSVWSEAVDMVYRATNNHCIVIGESELNGKTFAHLAILKGSSGYDSREFSIFLDGIISECEELGIECVTESEKNLLLTERENGH